MARILRPKVIGGSNKSKRKTPSGFVKTVKPQTDGKARKIIDTKPMSGKGYSSYSHKILDNQGNPLYLNGSRPIANMPNPAAKFAVDRGYKIKIVNGPLGQYGMVQFPDGTEMEEWAYFRANYKPIQRPIRRPIKKPRPTPINNLGLKLPKPKKIFGMGKI